MILFYTSDIQGTTAILHTEEARHCTQVVRKRVGEVIPIVDGKGSYYEATIIEITKKTCVTKIIKQDPSFSKRNFHLHIGIAPTKNMDRLEWFVEKATEIGIDEITPILCQRSERRRVRIDRLEKKALSAMKQSLKATLPIVNDLTLFKEAIQIKDTNSLKMIAQGAAAIALQDNYQAKKNVYILIGPEGDFTNDEMEAALTAGFQGVNLGRNRLRTETAGLVACHTANLLNQA